jgi:hypothetical protein
MFLMRKGSDVKYATMMQFGSALLMGMAIGCSPEGSGTTSVASKPSTAKENAKPAEDHGPHGSGPNGGVVFDLGKYHAEFAVDHPKKECTILVLGDDEKTPTAVAAKELTLTTKETKTEDGTVVAPMTIKMLPVDETDGKATKFVGSDPGIGNVADFEGTVLGEIDGKPSQGEFKE